jgi:demethylmenaquinone methyltransferase/2-methoxy-6-polyprenyl-1,4-benzoquinol methylase
MKENKQKLISKMFAKYFKANSWAEYNKAFFDSIAKKYDATNQFTSFGTKWILDKIVINKFKISENAKILDLCSGTCDIAIALAKKYPKSQITALDASVAMLEIGNKKIKKEKLNNITTTIGDALNLPFLDNYFDLVIVSFGLRNLDNLELGLKEMKRVAKENSPIVNVEYGKPKFFLFKFLYWLYFQNIAPFLGKIIFHFNEFNSFRYLPESNKYFPNQEELCFIMKNLGFREVKNYNYFLGVVAQQVCLK